MNSTLNIISNIGLRRISFMFDENSFFNILPKHKQQWRYIESLIPTQNKLNTTDYLTEIAHLIQTHPDYKINIEFLDKVISEYANILSGKNDLKNILFRNASFDTIIDLYTKTPETKYFNALLVKSIVSRIPKQSYLLELGSGIGSITSALLPLASKKITEYCYTDISKAFLYYAKNKFIPKFKNISLFEYNINDKPLAHHQDKYDGIIASDVIHNAKNIKDSINNIFLMLKSGGKLFINELTFPSLYSNLIYGLTPEWWPKNKKYRYEFSPTMPLKNWIQILNDVGFVNIITDHGSNIEFTHNIIIAEKP